jgi:hypothetical protein
MGCARGSSGRSTALARAENGRNCRAVVLVSPMLSPA